MYIWCFFLEWGESVNKLGGRVVDKVITPFPGDIEKETDHIAKLNFT